MNYIFFFNIYYLAAKLPFTLGVWTTTLATGVGTGPAAVGFSMDYSQVSWAAQ